jgi:predicted ATPase
LTLTILPIASHLLNCKSIIKREGAEEKLIEYLYLAGVKAKRSAAVEHALRLLSLGEELLGDSCWQKDYDNSFKIKLELAECEFICGKYDAAMEHFEEMLGHANGREALVEIKKRYMVMYSYAGNHDRVIDLGVQALKHLGINIDMHRLKIQIIREILYGRVLFRSGRLELIKNAPTITDKRLANALEILSIMAASANLLDGKLFILIVLKIGNLSAKHGNSPYSPLGYAAYGLVLGSVMGNYKKAERLKDISVSLAELFDDDLFAAPTYFCIGTFIAHWTSPAKESLDYLQKAFECGMRSGDYLYCGYTMILMTEMKYLIGTPFDELGKVLELNRKYAQRMNNDILLRSVAMFNDHMNMLSSPVFSGKERLVDDKEIEMLGTNEYMIYTLLKVQRLYLNGKLEEAYRLVRRAMKCLDTVMGSITQVDYVF